MDQTLVAFDTEQPDVAGTEVPTAVELQPEDILSVEFQQDLALVLTPMAVLGVAALWALNMKRGRIAAGAIDGLLVVLRGAMPAKKESNVGS